MPDIRIVLVNPIYEGNVGFTARVMKNFGFPVSCLSIPVKPARRHRSGLHMHRMSFRGQPVCCIRRSPRLQRSCNPTTVLSKSVCRSMRMPYFSPSEIRGKICDIDGVVSILFGREDWGLSNEEVKNSDMICTFPSSAGYRVLNISHAVGVICYGARHIFREASTQPGQQGGDGIPLPAYEFISR